MQALRTLPRAVLSARAFSTTTPRSLAKMQMIGRLTAEPEVQPTSTGLEVTRFSLAVQGRRKDEDGNKEVSFFRLSSFIEGQQRQLLLSQQKGAQMFVEADAKMDKFEDKETGQSRTSLNLVMRNFELLSRPQQQGEISGAESHKDPAEEPLSGIGQS